MTTFFNEVDESLLATNVRKVKMIGHLNVVYSVKVLYVFWLLYLISYSIFVHASFINAMIEVPLEVEHYHQQLVVINECVLYCSIT